MFKTYVDIPRRDHMYYIAHDIIMQHNGWDIVTTVYRPNYVRFYFTYKWFQYGKVQAFKKEARNYAKRVAYYDHTYIPKYLFAQEARPYSDKFKEAFTRLSYATIQGDPECRNGEIIVNENKEESK